MLDMEIIEELREIGILGELIDMLHEDAPAMIEDIKRCAELGDAQNLREVSHKLKGSSLNVGAQDLGDVCATIELKARDNDLSGMEDLIRKLDEVNEKTHIELQQIRS